MTNIYEILLNTYLMDDYMEGFIGGVIYSLTGMPEDSGYVICKDVMDTTMAFDATEDQANVVAECINKVHPEIYVGMRLAE